MKKTDLTVLLEALNDNRSNIVENAEKELSKQSVAAIPQLEDIWLETADKTLQQRLERIITNIQFTDVRHKLIEWAKSPNPNLIDGAILVNQSHNPDLDIKSIRKSITKIKQDILPEIEEHENPLDKIKALNNFFFNVHNFQVVSPENPSNWDGDIETVLSQKQGNYVVISTIYAAIAQELGLPVSGIKLPTSILLCYYNPDNINEVLFYINPVEKGKVSSKQELESLIQSKNINNRQQYYLPTTNANTIKRLVRYKIQVYRYLKLNSFIPKFNDLYQVI